MSTRLRLPAALLTTAIALSACGATASGTTGPLEVGPTAAPTATPEGLVHPTGPREIILRFDEAGGFVPVEWMASFGIEGQNPTNDPDNDGFTTAEEYISSTHPTNEVSFLRILRSWQANGTNYVEWESEGIDSELPDFVVESTDNLTNSFAPTGTVVRGATNTWMQAVPTGEKMFYRIQAGD